MRAAFFKILRREEREPKEKEKREKVEVPSKSIGLIIDGPNILRKEFGIKLENIKEALEKIGKIRVAKVVLNQYAPQGLIEAVVNQGFEPIIVAGDTDVRIAIEAMELIYNSDIEVIALATRDADFLPIISEGKRKGKETVVIGVEPGFSIALQNAADYVIKMEGKGGQSEGYEE
ncbi:MAG: TIGR00288 family NYN domain-containing protein [Thermococcus sp.]|uniref:TIGR00288 family NYN domain-containing protein n=1 Tax=Thermococcus litoralis TaxID=2265 RepID=A0A7C5P9H1_THELI|nr:TIGR00288 family NYN domain-containing protein [Thermococcus sp.]HHI00950.1 TIGR00288 family NYN domain-containing protein [Thermococcus litoralis]